MIFNISSFTSPDICIAFNQQVINFCNKEDICSVELLLEFARSILSWNELDEFPSVKECNSLNDSNLIRECFESFLSNHLLEKIDLSNVIIKNPINDTVTISLLINNSGKVTISKKNIPENIILNIPNFEILLDNSVDLLPIVLPATKTNLGVSVNSKFDLPIIIKSK